MAMLMEWAENFWAPAGMAAGLWSAEVLQFVSERTLELAASFFHTTAKHREKWGLTGTLINQAVSYPLLEFVSVCYLLIMLRGRGRDPMVIMLSLWGAARHFLVSEVTGMIHVIVALSFLVRCQGILSTYAGYGQKE